MELKRLVREFTATYGERLILHGDTEFAIEALGRLRGVEVVGPSENMKAPADAGAFVWALRQPQTLAITVLGAIRAPKLRDILGYLFRILQHHRPGLGILLAARQVVANSSSELVYNWNAFRTGQ